MKQFAIVAMFLGLGAGAAACKGGDKGAAEPVLGESAPAGQLQLTWQAPAVGRIETSVDNLDTRMKIAAEPGQMIDMVMTKSEKTHKEVVAVTPDGAIAKLKIRYEDHRETQTMGGQTEARPIPIAGKAYVVWAEGGAVKATHEDGSPVSPEEQAAIEEEEDELGKVPGMATLLLGRAWTTGEPVTLTGEELAQAVGPEEDMRPASGTMTLTGVDAGVATFELDMAAYMQDAQGKLDATLKMTMELDVAHVRPVAMRMTGSFSGKVQGMDTTGEMTGSKTFEYR